MPLDLPAYLVVVLSLWYSLGFAPCKLPFHSIGSLNTLNVPSGQIPGHWLSALQCLTFLAHYTYYRNLLLFMANICNIDIMNCHYCTYFLSLTSLQCISLSTPARGALCLQCTSATHCQTWGIVTLHCAEEGNVGSGEQVHVSQEDAWTGIVYNGTCGNRAQQKW